MNERNSTLVRWNTPLVRAWYLKEAVQPFWAYKRPWRAEQHLRKWMNSAMRSKLPGSDEKSFAFPPESLFAFSPESLSPSPRNPFLVRPESAIDRVHGVGWSGPAEARVRLTVTNAPGLHRLDEIKPRDGLATQRQYNGTSQVWILAVRPCLER
jgi:Transposase